MIFFSSINYLFIFNVFNFFFYLFFYINIKINTFKYVVAYIFTELFGGVLNVYIIFNNIFSNFFNYVISIIIFVLPFIVKALIGYCHFYYQLGYGVLFYIYLFKRYKTKQKKNWKYFYGNSTTNWFLINVSLFNKFFLDKNLWIFFKNHIKNTLMTLYFLTNYSNSIFVFYKKISKFYIYVIKKFNLYIWTPIFKRSSYISLLTFLKRFNKRK